MHFVSFDPFLDRLITFLKSSTGLIPIISSRKGVEQSIVSLYSQWLFEKDPASIHGMRYEHIIQIADSDESIVVDLSWNNGSHILNVYSLWTNSSYDKMDPNALSISKTISQIEDAVINLASTQVREANLVFLLVFHDEKNWLFTPYVEQLDLLAQGVGAEKGWEVTLNHQELDLFSDVKPAVAIVTAKLLNFKMWKRDTGLRNEKLLSQQNESGGTPETYFLDTRYKQFVSDYGKENEIRQIELKIIEETFSNEINRFQKKEYEMYMMIDLLRKENLHLHNHLSQLSTELEKKKVIAFEESAQKATFDSKKDVNVKPIKLKTNTYRECLREIRDELLKHNETIRVHELAGRFEERVKEKYRKQCLHQLSSEPKETLESTIKELTEGMLSTFKSGGGGARYAQIHLYCVNSSLRKYYRKPIGMNPEKDSKSDFNFFAFPYIDKQDKNLKFNDKRIKAFNLDDDELNDVEVYAIYDGDEDYTKIRVVEIKKGNYPKESATAGVNTRKKRGRKPKLPVITEKKTPYPKILIQQSGKKSNRGQVKDAQSHSKQVAPSTGISKTNTGTISLSDKIWIAVAQLHRERPEAEYFKNAHIIKKIADLFCDSDVNQVDAGAHVLISAHLVAEEPKKGVRRRYLASAGRAKRRLFKESDVSDSTREGAETHPVEHEIGKQFKDLIDWYEDWSKN